MFDLVFLRELLVSSVHVLQLLLEAISVICVVIGLVKTLIVWIRTQKSRKARYCFGDWLQLH